MESDILGKKSFCNFVSNSFYINKLDFGWTLKFSNMQNFHFSLHSFFLSKISYISYVMMKDHGLEQSKLCHKFQLRLSARLSIQYCYMQAIEPSRSFYPRLWPKSWPDWCFFNLVWPLAFNQNYWQFPSFVHVSLLADKIIFGLIFISLRFQITIEIIKLAYEKR